MTAKLRPDVSLTETETETETEAGAVLLDERTGRYFQLNRTGLHILRALLAGHSIEQTAEELARRYPVPEDRARADVDSPHGSLQAAGLII